MDLTNYDTAFEVAPFGFANMGSTCYFNAVLQSLLSCTSFVQELARHPELYANNPVADLLIGLFMTAESMKDTAPDQIAITRAKLGRYSPFIWKEMAKFLSEKNKKVFDEFLVGQQCAREGFHCLLDALEPFDRIQNLFTHRYRTVIYCDTCNAWVSNVESIGNVFTVTPGLDSGIPLELVDQFKKHNPPETQDMLSYISNQHGFVEDYVCVKCKDNQAKYTLNRLTMIPEILVVLAKKYRAGRKLDVYTDFPATMRFKGKNASMTYTAVAQIEHSGGLNGGHYWAVCRRSDGWYTLNDMHVSKSEFRPTKDTYMVFYHSE